MLNKFKSLTRCPLILSFRHLSLSSSSTFKYSDTIIDDSSSITKFQSKNINYNIRLADIYDIPGIRNCNLSSLPENYTDVFYKNFLVCNPGLCIVAERNDDKLIGYALGRVEIKIENDLKVLYGHVTSVAVINSCRGEKVGLNLMKRLHHNLTDLYSVDKVSLHCRTNNNSALNMYSKSFNYKYIEKLISYYGDGEDAFLMTMIINNNNNNSNSEKINFKL
jgi:ribosomal protein S18 acetylase RimI-like enzyme